MLDRPRLALLLVLLGITVFRMLTIGELGLGDSEAYYWVWSQHLALSYFDHPAGIALMIRMFTELGGNSAFFVRLGPMLLFPFTVLFLSTLASDIAEVPGDKSMAALYTGLALIATPAIGIGGISASPDTPLAFFVSGFLLATKRAVSKQSGFHLVAAGLLLGAACLFKYFALLYLPLLLAWFLRKDMRRWWSKPWLYIAGLLASAGFLPSLLWNMNHHWASFVFHTHDRHSHAGLSLTNLGMLIGGQIGYISPLILVALLSTAWKLAKSRKEWNTAQGLLSYMSIPYLVFFYVVTLITPEAEPHWPLLGYFPLYAYLGAAWASPSTSNKIQGRAFANWAIGVGGFVVLLVHVHVLTPWIALSMPRDVYMANARFDLANELRGWPAAGSEVRKMLEENNASFAFSYHYTLCSQLSFALRGEIPVYCPNTRVDAFDFLGLSNPPLGGDGVFLGDWRYRADPRSIYSCKYLDVEPKIVEVFDHGLKIREFRLYRCKGYQGLKQDAPTGL